MAAMLIVKNVTKQFGGLMANQSVVGPNGAGKTTLFNCISRTHSLTAGQIVFDDKDVTNKKSFEVCKLGMGRTYQIPQSMEDMTTLENIVIGALCHRASVIEAEDYARDISEFCELSAYNNVDTSCLNVLQKKRLEIARALASDPKLLLLDETMAGLSGIERINAIDLIRKINAKGITILMIEHVMEVVMTVSEKVIVIVSGKKLTEGPPCDVTKDPEVIDAYLGGD